VVSFSIPAEEKEALLSILDKIAEREGKSRSEVIVEAIKEYVKTHAGLNPQISLIEVCNPVDEVELSTLKFTLDDLIRRAPRTERAMRAYGSKWVKEVMSILPRARRIMARSGDKSLANKIGELKKLLDAIAGTLSGGGC